MALVEFVSLKVKFKASTLIYTVFQTKTSDLLIFMKNI